MIQRRSWAAACRDAVLLLAAALVFRGLSFTQAVIDIDEGLYMLQAREWLRGAWPYVAVWDMHPVGAPALFALAMAVLGDGIWGLRLLAAATAAATGAALLAIARQAGLGPALGWAAALLYLANTALLGGLAANTEILFAPFVAWAIALGAAAPAVGPEARRLILMGALVGIALLIKPVAFFEGSLAWLLAVVPALRRGALGPTALVARALAYAALCALPAALVAAGYALRGEWAAFVDGAILAPLRYVDGRVPPGDALRYALAAALTLAWTVALALAAALDWRRGAPARRVALLALLWLAAASAAIVSPGRYYPHYFLIALPPLCLLAALGARRLARHLAPRRVRPVFAVAIAAAALDAWVGAAVPRLYNPVGLTRPDPVRVVAAAIAARIVPGEPIWVVNYLPVVHVLAGAGLATRYAFPPHLVGPYAAVTGIDADAEIARILASRPTLLIVYRGWWQQMRPEAAALVAAALVRSYRREVEIAEAIGAVELWRRIDPP